MDHDPATGKFVAGNKGGPGRSVGARNKLGSCFLQEMQQDFVTHGKTVIEQVRTERPHEYLKIVTALLPKELHLKDNTLDDMTDDDIGEILTAIRALRAGRNGEASAGEPGATDETAPSRH